MTILVVEDDPALRKVVAAALSSCHVVVGAETGLQALDYVSQSRPDLVVLDLELPEVDGWEVLARCRARAETADMPIVVMSASHRVVVSELHADAFFAKPFDLDDLLDTVELLLARARPNAPLDHASRLEAPSRGQG